MSRKKARETAFKVLFQVDLGKVPVEKALEKSLENERISGPEAAFVRKLVEGVLEQQKEIDRRIQSFSPEWTLERMATTDRNVLRLGFYELLNLRDEVPSNVVINEAVELAKKFGTADSGRFVNGILGNMLKSELNGQGRQNTQEDRTDSKDLE